MKYEKRGEYFCLLNAADEIIQRLEDVAVLYDASANQLLQHGDPELIREVYDDMKDSYPGGLVMVESRHWTINELNDLIKNARTVAGLQEKILGISESSHQGI